MSDDSMINEWEGIVQVCMVHMQGLHSPIKARVSVRCQLFARHDVDREWVPLGGSRSTLVFFATRKSRKSSCATRTVRCHKVTPCPACSTASGTTAICLARVVRVSVYLAWLLISRSHVCSTLLQRANPAEIIYRSRVVASTDGPCSPRRSGLMSWQRMHAQFAV